MRSSGTEPIGKRNSPRETPNTVSSRTPWPAARAEGHRRLLLLDGLGGGNRPPGNELHLHQQLAIGPLGGECRLDAGLPVEPAVHPGPASRSWASWSTSFTDTASSTARRRPSKPPTSCWPVPVTPSQLSSAKFFLVAGLLFVVQIFNGGLLAHYTVHPGTFYIEFIGQIYPYAWAKTWHLQLAILWIALSWMGTAIYLAPLVGGREPGGQRAMVNILFVAAVAVTVGQPGGRGSLHQGLLRRRVVLAGPSGLGVSGARTALADSALRRADLLARGRVSGRRPHPAAEPKGNRRGVGPQGAHHLLRLQRHLRGGILRLRPLLWAGHAPDRGRLLALVRGAHLGGEYLRVLRRRRDLHVPGDAGPGDRQLGAAGGLPDGHPGLHRRHPGHRAPLLLVSADPASGWPSAASSARWSRSR